MNQPDNNAKKAFHELKLEIAEELNVDSINFKSSNRTIDRGSDKTRQKHFFDNETPDTFNPS